MAPSVPASAPITPMSAQPCFGSSGWLGKTQRWHGWAFGSSGPRRWALKVVIWPSKRMMAAETRVRLAK